MEMLSYCGLLCHECIIFKATAQNNNDLRAEAVKMFGSDDYPLTIADINCYGCKAVDKQLFKFCNECEMRACAMEKQVESCGHWRGATTCQQQR